MTRGGCVEWGPKNQPARPEEESTKAQQEDEERQCNSKLVQREDKRVAQREDGKRQCNNQLGHAALPLEEHFPPINQYGEALFRVITSQICCSKKAFIVM